MMTTINIEYGGETVTLTCNLAEASAPLVVGSERTQYQTADARHRADLAVALACSVAWPDVTWPAVPATGTIGEIEATEAWDEMSYEVDGDLAEATDEQISALRLRAVNDTTREIMRDGVLLTHDEADDLGVEVIDWMTSRLGLKVVETDQGVECRRG